jgi:hypothetical protein
MSKRALDVEMSDPPSRRQRTLTQKGKEFFDSLRDKAERRKTTIRRKFPNMKSMLDELDKIKSDADPEEANQEIDSLIANFQLTGIGGRRKTRKYKGGKKRRTRKH